MVAMGRLPSHGKRSRSKREAILFAGRRCPRGRILGEPLPGDDLETVRGLFLPSELFSLAVFAGVNACRQQLAGGVPFVPGGRQRGVGIGPQRQPLFFAVETVLQAPPLATGFRDFEIEPASIEQALHLVGGLGFADRGIGEVHWGQLLPRGGVLPPLAPGLQGPPRDTSGHKKGRNPCIY